MQVIGNAANKDGNDMMDKQMKNLHGHYLALAKNPRQQGDGGATRFTYEEFFIEFDLSDNCIMDALKSGVLTLRLLFRYMGETPAVTRGLAACYTEFLYCLGISTKA